MHLFVWFSDNSARDFHLPAKQSNQCSFFIHFRTVQVCRLEELVEINLLTGVEVYILHVEKKECCDRFFLQIFIFYRQMSSIRQTPRSIRFAESIHIREFPRDDTEIRTTDNPVQPRESWEPNLSDVKHRLFFENEFPIKFLFVDRRTTQSTIEEIEVCRSWNSHWWSCTHRHYHCNYPWSCSRTKKLICQFFMKTSRFIFLLFSATTAADNSRTYNEACQIGSSQCTVSQGLFCSNGFCSCSSSYSWNSINNTCKLIWIVFNEIIWQRKKNRYKYFK